MRNLLLYVLAGILLVLAILVLKRNPHSSLSKTEQQVGFDDPASIDRVTIVGKNGSLSLQQTESGWVVNDSFPVKPGLAETFVTTLSTIQVKAPVQRSERKVMIRLAEDSGLVVTIYHGSGSVLRAYRVCKRSHEPGTCLLAQGTEKPVWIEIPGFSGEPFRIFRNASTYWTDQVLFTLQPQHIASLRIRNLKQNNGLLIRRDSPRDPWQTYALPDTLHPFHPDKLALEDWLNAFRRVPVKELDRNISDSLVSLMSGTSPRWIIERTGFKGERENVMFWPRMLPVPGKQQSIQDPDQALVYIRSRNRMGVVKYADLDKVLIDPEYLSQQ